MSGRYRQERVDQVRKALLALKKTARYILWINPFPLERWQGTSAEGIHNIIVKEIPNAKMITWDPVSLGQPPHRILLSGVTYGS